MPGYNYKIEIWCNDIFTNRTLLLLDHTEAETAWLDAIKGFKYDRGVMLKMILDDTMVIKLWKNPRQ